MSRFAINIDDRAALVADEVVVVVVDPYLIESGASSRLEAAHNPDRDKVAQCVIDRLEARLGKRCRDTPQHIVGARVRMIV